ncbi:hypothetical protein B0I29_12482 [Actinoplanes lutulentus]|uniref:Uncharacterized protein n=1 Tax=Actinoplanes lutulentus TaxID=1287878 RepID=A0A327YZL9_9ACTN|nr:hypothetical protein B0I29_12482 [Actinoplanes lutulentus]
MSQIGSCVLAAAANCHGCVNLVRFHARAVISDIERTRKAIGDNEPDHDLSRAGID